MNRRWKQLREALARRLHGPYPLLAQVEEIHALLGSIGAAVERNEMRLAGLETLPTRIDAIVDALGRIEALQAGEIRSVLRVLAADEPRNRRALFSAREQPDYGLAWDEDRPLVSIIVATIGRPELLAERALPSILGQTHENLEVVVVSDGAGASTENVVRDCDDPRLRFSDLGPRFLWEAEPGRRWLAAATRAMNAGLRLATGRWILHFDDDDELAPEGVEKLLALARAERAELVYGRLRIHNGKGGETVIGECPPSPGQLSGGGCMYHAGLRFFEREYIAAAIGVPGDWWLAERMLRAGVRFAMHPDVVADVYPSWTRGETPAYPGSEG